MNVQHILNSGPAFRTIESNDHIGRSIRFKMPNVAKVQHLTCEDQCQTIQDLADEIGFGYGICQRTLIHELDIALPKN